MEQEAFLLQFRFQTANAACSFQPLVYFPPPKQFMKSYALIARRPTSPAGGPCEQAVVSKPKSDAASKVVGAVGARVKRPMLCRKPCTVEKMAEFLANLSEGDPVCMAARKTGLDPSRFYERKRVDAEFAEMWVHAYNEGTSVYEAIAQQRARGWYEEKFDKDGKKLGDVLRYDSTLLMFVLKKRDPSYRENFTLEAGDSLKQLVDGWKQTSQRMSLSGEFMNLGDQEQHREATQH